jgi:hypothetical protein
MKIVVAVLLISPFFLGYRENLRDGAALALDIDTSTM